jgi:hypothetical protein
MNHYGLQRIKNTEGKLRLNLKAFRIWLSENPVDKVERSFRQIIRKNLYYFFLKQ